MLEMSSLFEMLELFHAVIFAFKQGLADVIQTDTTPVVIHYMMHYLDLVFENMPSPRLIEYGDVEETLWGLARLLVRSDLAEEVAVEKTEEGFNFRVEGCRFAGRVHHLLEPRDVTCLYGILAFYLAEKSSGRRVVKALSEFTPTDAQTPIEFLE